MIFCTLSELSRSRAWGDPTGFRWSSGQRRSCRPSRRQRRHCRSSVLAGCGGGSGQPDGLRHGSASSSRVSCHLLLLPISFVIIHTYFCMRLIEGYAMYSNLMRHRDRNDSRAGRESTSCVDWMQILPAVGVILFLFITLLQKFRFLKGIWKKI